MTTGQRRELRAESLSKEAIVAQAGVLIARYVSIVGREKVLRSGIRFEDVYENVILPEYGVKLHDGVPLPSSSGGGKNLGAYYIPTNEAFIDIAVGPNSLDPRRVFTLWHEVGGHGVLQGEWLRQQVRSGHPCSLLETSDLSISPLTSVTLERQANLFAAHAAAPMWLVDHSIVLETRLSHPITFVGPRTYFIEGQGVCRPRFCADFGSLCEFVAEQIRHRFGGLSIESLGYQVRQSRWLVNCCTDCCTGGRGTVESLEKIASGLTLRRSAASSNWRPQGHSMSRAAVPASS